MFLSDRVLLRLHIEAVWGVQLPVIEQDEIELLPASNLPPWRLYAANLANGRVTIWRRDVAQVEREALLTRLTAALTLPVTAAPPPGVSREVAFRLAAKPAMERTVAQQFVRLQIGRASCRERV